MKRTINACIRWLLRVDQQRDPLVNRILRRNREALERRRRCFAHAWQETI